MEIVDFTGYNHKGGVRRCPVWKVKSSKKTKMQLSLSTLSEKFK